MKLSFAELLRVDLQHGYHGAAVNHDFIIEPTAACRAVLEDRGLLFKATPQGFSIFYQSQPGAPPSHPRQPLDGSWKLSFMLKAVNRWLFNYSHLPLDSLPRSLFWVSNIGGRQSQGDLLLSREDFASPADFVELRPQSFPHSWSTASALAAVELLDERGRAVRAELVPAASGQANYWLHLPQPGRYSLRADGVVQLEYYASDELTASRVFGVIDLSAGEGIPQPYRFVDAAGRAAPKVFSLRFEGRETFWKYQIVLKHRTGIDPGELSLSHPDPTVSFDPQPPQTLSNGLKAIPFVSNKALALRPQPVKNIQLKKSGAPGAFELDNLPNPSYHQGLKPAPAEGRVYSEVYVYI